MSEVYLGDARSLKDKIPKESLDVTITSPPYFDMKDYGHADQIGFGQNYQSYLKDLKRIFKDVHYATKSSGSLWVIIDTFKRDGAVVTLPFDFAREISNVGWKLQDIIVWKKDKTVPWSKKGTTRKIFEYVLFFSKTDDFKYYSERAREIRDLKEWWVRYPERYSPYGKSLEEIWEYSIPTQGSWGEGYIKHFCPLPEDLVKRILLLTTDEGDTVFDPFSGSGTVPAQAAFMARSYYGFELNESYLNMFNAYLQQNVEQRLKDYKASAISVDAEVFKETILNLRILKFARVLFKKLRSEGLDVQKVGVERKQKALDGKYEVASAEYVLLVDPSSVGEIDAAINQITHSPPLSKFGIAADFEVVTDSGEFVKRLPSDRLFHYTANNTHQYQSESSARTKSDRVIFSSIEVNINEEIYRSAK